MLSPAKLPMNELLGGVPSLVGLAPARPLVWPVSSTTCWASFWGPLEAEALHPQDEQHTLTQSPKHRVVPALMSSLQPDLPDRWPFPPCPSSRMSKCWLPRCPSQSTDSWPHKGKMQGLVWEQHYPGLSGAVCLNHRS